MSNEPSLGVPALTISVRLVNGETCVFTVDDALQADSILDGIDPSELFSKSHNLVFGGDKSLSYFPAHHVERVKFIGANVPQWSYLGGAEEIIEIEDDEFQRAYDPDVYADHRVDVANYPGSDQIGFTEFWTKSNLKRYWQVRMKSHAITEWDVDPYIENMLKSGGLHAVVDGGVAVVNPANVVRVIFHPGPPKLPVGAWHARRK